jgi:hypothetical protein
MPDTTQGSNCLRKEFRRRLTPDWAAATIRFSPVVRGGPDALAAMQLNYLKSETILCSNNIIMSFSQYCWMP